MEESVLKFEFDYYVEHQDAFVDLYDGKVIILFGDMVLAIFDTISEAYFYAQERDWLGKAMLHTVGPGVDNYTTYIWSPWCTF